LFRSDRVHAGGKAEFGSVLLTASIPVIEIVAAIVLDSALPGEETFGLVLHGHARLELRVEILATVTSILGNH